MQQIIDLFMAHQVLGTLLLGAVWSAFIGSLPAPGANSSSMYRFVFSFFNILAANFQRAFNTSLESSPNYKDHLKQIGVPVPPETPKP